MKRDLPHFAGFQSGRLMQAPRSRYGSKAATAICALSLIALSVFTVVSIEQAMGHHRDCPTEAC